jgi:hypothetical protein
MLKLSLLADDMILHLNNLKDSRKRKNWFKKKKSGHKNQ